MTQEQKKKTLIIGGVSLVVLLVLYACTGFLIAPMLVKKLLPEKLGQALGRTVAVEDVSINPFLLNVEVVNFSVKKKQAPQEDFISFKRAFVDLSGKSLFKLAPVASQVTLEGPSAAIVLNPDQTFNFSDLMVPSEKEPAPENEEKKWFGFSVSNIQIIDGKILFSDKVRGTDHAVEDLDVDLPLISSFEKDLENPVNLDVSLLLNQAKITLGLESRPFSADLETRLTLAVSAMDLTHYLNYVPVPEAIAVKSLNFGCDIQGDFVQTDGTTRSLVLQGSAGLEQLSIQEKGGAEVLDLPKLSVKLNPSDLLKTQVNLESVILDAPRIRVGRDKNGTLNLISYLGLAEAAAKQKAENPENAPPSEPAEETAAPASDTPETVAQESATPDTAATPEAATKPAQPAGQASAAPSKAPAIALKLNQAKVQGMVISFTDQSNSHPFEMTINPLDIQVDQVRFDGTCATGDLGLSLKTGNNETITVKGQFASAPLTLDMDVAMADWDLTHYAPYYQDMVGFDLKGGTFKVAVGIKVAQDPDKADAPLNILVENKAFTLSALDIWDRVAKESPVKVPELTVTGSTVDVSSKKVNLGNIATSNGRLIIRRKSDGTLNLVSNLMGQPATAKPSSKSAKTDKTTGKSGKAAKSAGKGTGPESADWQVAIGSFDLGGYALSFQDKTTKTPVKLDLSDIAVKASDIGTAITSKGAVEAGMTWNKKGKIKAKGDFILPELKSNLNLDLTQIDIKPLEPYFTEAIKISITSGFINTKGKVSLDLNKKPEPAISFKGESSLNNFLSLDKATSNDFFKCNSLSFSGVDVSMSPMKINIKGISLTDFYSRLILSKDGQLNVKQVFMQEDEAATADAEAGAKAKTAKTAQSAKPAPKAPAGGSAGPEINVDNITLTGGHIEFSDYFNKPNFTSNMKEITGSVNGLSSMDSSNPAQVGLKGVHGDSSPLVISGRISPLTQKKFVDLNVSFKDIELAKFSPYSSKYIGRKIQKGKLVLDLNYNIDGNTLNSKNRLFIDQFTLGEKTESKDATSLPVGLAISLLKNKKGEIDLDLPITGNLDDPEFRFGSVVLKVITNLIVKVVTAPFSILGAMFEGGEELGYVEFAHGKAVIDAENTQKLDKLITVLTDKPELNLEIQGVFDAIEDARAMARAGFEHQLKALKVEKTGGSVADLDGVEIPDQEKEALILEAYEKAGFAKPQAQDGTEKQLSTEEKQVLLVSHVIVNEADVKALAMARAEAIKNYIISMEKVPRERLFLLDPVAADAKDSDGQSVKVQFSFK